MIPMKYSIKGRGGSACNVVHHFKHYKPSAKDLFPWKEYEYAYSCNAIQMCCITNEALLEVECWNRCSPPKFWCLLAKGYSEDNDLEQQFENSGFLLIAGLFDSATQITLERIAKETDQGYLLMDAVRALIDPYDTSGYSIKVWILPQ